MNKIIRHDADYAPNRWARRTEETAEAAYMRQHAVIADAITKLQATLDLMQAPDESVVPINWTHVAEFAHVAAAADVLIESVG